jgi:hypothetical protein
MVIRLSPRRLRTSEFWESSFRRSLDSPPEIPWKSARKLTAAERETIRSTAAASPTKTRRPTWEAGGARDPAALCGPFYAIHSSSSRKSAADCQRASESFARHLRTSRSSAAGVTGFERSQRWWFLFQNRRDQAGLALRVKRRFAADHFIQHPAEREDVAARIRRLPFQLLRRHVL